MPYADPIKRKEHDRAWRKAHPEKLREYYRTFRDKPGQKEIDNAKCRKRYHANKEKEKNRKALAYLENTPKFRARNKQWKIRNPEWSAKNAAKHRAANPERFRKKGREDMKRRRLDPGNKIADSLRIRIWSVLKGNAKSSNTSKLLGCSFYDFKIYLESKFEPGMSWDNYGSYWEIDHIMPCAIFNLTLPGHQKRCFHFSNHQPLTVSENRRKHCKVITDQYQLL